MIILMFHILGLIPPSFLNKKIIVLKHEIEQKKESEIIASDGARQYLRLAKYYVFCVRNN